MISHSKAMVTLEKEKVGRDFRPTVYMGIDCDSGPSEPTLLEDVTDLYINFNSFSKSNSYIMAEFCLLKGYKVLGQRVSTLTQPSSSRKFLVGERSYYASPDVSKDYSEGYNSEIYDYLDRQSSSYSVILTIDPTFSNDIVPDDFIVVVPKFTLDNSSLEYNTTSIILAGPYWSKDITTENELYQKIDYNPNRSRVLGYSAELQPNTLTVSKFESYLVEFLTRWCNLTVERIGETNSYYVESQTNLNNLEFINCETMNGEFISSEVSDIGSENNICRQYDSNKVCTVYSKDYSSIDDISVEITESSETYSVFVTKVNNEGVPVYSESFFYSTQPESDNFLENLSEDSLLVNIDIHDYTKSCVGKYELKGGIKISEVSDFNKMVEEDPELGYPVDFCVDNNESTERATYLDWLLNSFKTSLVFTDYLPRSTERIVQVSPKVEFYDSGTRYVMKGFAYLLYLLPNDVGIAYQNIKVIDDGSSYSLSQNYIEEGDYGIQLVGVKSKISSILPIKSSIFITCLNNLIISNDYESTSVLTDAIDDASSRVNAYLGTNYEVSVNSVLVKDRVAYADLTVRVETQIFGNYQVIANISW